MAIRTQIKKRYLLSGLLLLGIALCLFFSDKLLSAYAGLFYLDNAQKGADCVLILSGNAQTRPDHAARLILEGYAPRLYHTDQKRWNRAHPEIFGHPFDLAQKILGTYNLSADIIPSTKGGATSTFDEARDFALFLQSHPMKRVILVTDAFHTARAHYAFRKIMDEQGYEDLCIQMSAAPNNVFNENNWWKSERGVSMYILEPFKYLFYLFHNTNTTLVNED